MKEDLKVLLANIDKLSPNEKAIVKSIEKQEIKKKRTELSSLVV